MTDDLKPPVARYRFELVITGNTLEEIEHEARVQINDFDYENATGRTTRSQYGGRHHLIVDEPNPDMTADRYDDELQAWAEQRHVNRA